MDCKVLLGDFRAELSGMQDKIDAILLPDVLEHIDDDKIFLRDVVRLLKQNAILLITVPAHMFLWSYHDVINGHKRRYSAKSLRSLWKELDVQELFFTSFNTILFPAIALFRILKPRGSVSGKSDLYLPSPWINRILYKVFSAEQNLIRLFPLPFGISYLVFLRKK